MLTSDVGQNIYPCLYQMTKMLDILEAFLNYHGYVYMRLDGSTRVEMRQALMERFNNDNKYFIFILSTRYVLYMQAVYI